jgi:putative MATE family efflux protein
VRLTEGEPHRQILGLAGYMMLGSVATMTFQLADAYFVAQLGTEDLAALALTFPVVMILHAIAIGLGTGVTAVIARTYGQGDMARARVLTTDSIMLAFAIAVVFAVVGHATMDPLFRAMGASESMLPRVEGYMDIWYYGMPFMVVPLIANAVIRAFGDAKFPSLIMAITAVLNIILDPILIFGAFGLPGMGLPGAAVALLIARFVTLVASVVILHFRMHAIDYSVPAIARLKDSWGALLHIGLPATGTQMITPVSAAILTSLVASFGATAIAAYGVVTRIEMFSLIFTMALSISIAPFVGQNAGAGRMDRVRAALSFSYKAAMVYGIAVAGLLAVVGRWVAGEFSDEPAVIEIAALYLAVVPLSYGFMGIVNISSGCLNALARPMPAMAIGLARSLIVQVPLAYAGAALWGLRGLFGSLAVTTTVVAGLAFVLARRATETAAAPCAAGSRPSA